MVSIPTRNGEIFLFVLSVDDMLGKEYQFILIDFSQLMEAKIEKLILHVIGWVNEWIVIAVTRLYSCMIQVSLLPRPLQDMETYWELGSGLVLAQ